MSNKNSDIRHNIVLREEEDIFDSDSVIVNYVVADDQAADDELDFIISSLTDPVSEETKLELLASLRREVRPGADQAARPRGVDQAARPRLKREAVARKIIESEESDVERPTKSSTREENTSSSIQVGNSDVIYRDDSGRRINREDWDALQEQRALKKRPIKTIKRISEKELEWGGGVKQKRDIRLRAEEQAEIIQGPFQRFEIEDSLDKELKQATRWGDPLLDDETNPVVTSKSETTKFPAPPNRYSIKPGPRWDGRIRGNGFEARFLAARSAKLATPKFMIHSAMD